MEVLVGLGAVLVAGLLAARLSTHLRLPAVTGYLLVGMIIGPAALGFVDEGVLEKFSPFNQFALVFIALGIGRELDVSYLQQLGSSVLYLAVLQALVPFTLVFAALVVVGTPLTLALVLSVISAATAPALTVAVMHEMHSDGPLTRTHLVVVAMDDMIVIVAFSLALPLAQALTQGQWQWQWLTGITCGVEHVGGSLLLAVAGGWSFVLVAGRLGNESELVVAMVGLLTLLAGLSARWGLSPLLVALVCGIVTGNRSRFARALDRQMQALAPLLLIAFFVVAGSSLEPSSLLRAGQIGILYMVLRAVGKVLAVYLGAWCVPMNPMTRKYLGLTLMPQASVAVGMMVMAQDALPQFAEMISSVILGAVFIYELVGPSMTRFAVIKAGEEGKETNYSERKDI